MRNPTAAIIVPTTIMRIKGARRQRHELSSSSTESSQPLPHFMIWYIRSTEPNTAMQIPSRIRIVPGCIPSFSRRVIVPMPPPEAIPSPFSAYAFRPYGLFPRKRSRLGPPSRHNRYKHKCHLLNDDMSAENPNLGADELHRCEGYPTVLRLLSRGAIREFQIASNEPDEGGEHLVLRIGQRTLRVYTRDEGHLRGKKVATGVVDFVEGRSQFYRVSQESDSHSILGFVNKGDVEGVDFVGMVTDILDFSTDAPVSEAIVSDRVSYFAILSLGKDLSVLFNASSARGECVGVGDILAGHASASFRSFSMPHVPRNEIPATAIDLWDLHIK